MATSTGLEPAASSLGRMRRFKSMENKILEGKKQEEEETDRGGTQRSRITGYGHLKGKPKTRNPA